MTLTQLVKMALGCLNFVKNLFAQERFKKCCQELSIFIINALSRILPMLIIERHRDCYESLIMENQFGFRQNRSMTDAIFIVCEELSLLKIHCMIDLRAAYDHIDRDISVLNIRTKAPKITSLLKELYTGTKASIKTLLTLSKCTLVVVKEELNPQFYLIFISISYSDVLSMMFYGSILILILSH